MNGRRGLWVAVAVLAVALSVVALRSKDGPEVLVLNAPTEWSAGWDAAIIAVGKENFYARNAAERVQAKYLRCKGGGGTWSVNMAACQE